MTNASRKGKLRVLHVGPLPPPYGGVGVLLKTILDSRLREICELSHFNTQKPGQEEKPSTPTAADFFYTILNAFRLPLLIAKTRPDVVHFQSTADTGFVRDGLLVFSARLAGSRIVLHFHGTPGSNLFPGKRLASRLFFRFVTSVTRKVILNTEGFREGFRSLVPLSRSFAFPNVVFCDGFRSVEERGWEGGFRVLFVGRLSRSKGFWDLLEAMAPLLRETSELSLSCMGVPEAHEEEEFQRIRMFLRERGIEGKVELLGRVPSRERGAVFAKSHVFVLPTRNDVFPVTLSEAMAAGLPVIVTRQGAIPEIVREGTNGFLVKEGSVEQIRKRIEFLMQRRSLAKKMGEFNRKVALESFDADRRAEDLMELYREVVSS